MVAPVATEALTILCRDFSESSQLVTVFTPDFGRVRTLARGARRPKSDFGGGIDLLAWCEVTLYPRRRGRLTTMASCYMRDCFGGIRRRLPALATAFWVAEILNRTTGEYDPAPGLYRLALFVLRGLDRGDDVLLLRFLFTARALKLLGYFPQLRRCVLCARGGISSAQVWLSICDGGVVCGGCAGRCVGEGKGGLVRTNPGTVATLEALAYASLHRLRNMRFSNRMAIDVWEVLLGCVQRVLGERPRTARWFEES